MRVIHGDMKKNYTFEFHYSPQGKEVAVTITRKGKRVSLSPKDFSVKGNVLTLNKAPEDYFK